MRITKSCDSAKTSKKKNKKNRKIKREKQQSPWDYYDKIKKFVRFHLDHVNGAIAEEIGLRRDGRALDVLLLTSEAKREREITWAPAPKESRINIHELSVQREKRSQSEDESLKNIVNSVI